MEWRVFVGVLGLVLARIGIENKANGVVWFGALIAAFAFGAAA